MHLSAAAVEADGVRIGEALGLVCAMRPKVPTGDRSGRGPPLYCPFWPAPTTEANQLAAASPVVGSYWRRGSLVLNGSFIVSRIPLPRITTVPAPSPDRTAPDRRKVSTTPGTCFKLKRKPQARLCLATVVYVHLVVWAITGRKKPHFSASVRCCRQ